MCSLPLPLSLSLSLSVSFLFYLSLPLSLSLSSFVSLSLSLSMSLFFYASGSVGFWLCVFCRLPPEFSATLSVNLGVNLRPNTGRPGRQGMCVQNCWKQVKLCVSGPITFRFLISIHSGRILNTDFFFANIDIPAKIPGSPAKMFVFLGFRGTYRIFWPPPLHVEDPHPTGRYPDPSLSFSRGWVSKGEGGGANTISHCGSSTRSFLVAMLFRA